MASWELNGVPVMQGKVNRPRVGNWVAELQIDVASITGFQNGAGAVLTIDGTVSLSGTVFRSGDYSQNITLRLLGGRNGLRRGVVPRFYQNVQLVQPLGDVLRDAGEVLASGASAAALGTVLEFWTMVAQPASEALSSLADAAGSAVVWRVLADGTVFLGTDGFLPSALVDFELVEFMPLEGVQVIATEVPDVHPGEQFNGFNVSCVEHLLTPGGSRVRLFYE